MPPTMMQEAEIAYPTDKIVPYIEILTSMLNKYRERHMEQVMRYHEAIKRRKFNPQAMIMTQVGEKSITQILTERINAISESREVVAALTEMLAEAQESEDKLAERWADDKLHAPVDLNVSPLDGRDFPDGLKK